MIYTDRLTIRIASDDEMLALVTEETDPELKSAYCQMRALSITYPSLRQWYAAWLIELPDGTRVGDLRFKGLSDDGTVEIGYGLLPAYRGNGYASEVVAAMAAWAAKQPGVFRVEAETEPDNFASQKVLAHAGFMPNGFYGIEGPRYTWHENR